MRKIFTPSLLYAIAIAFFCFVYFLWYRSIEEELPYNYIERKAVPVAIDRWTHTTKVELLDDCLGEMWIRSERGKTYTQQDTLLVKIFLNKEGKRLYGEIIGLDRIYGKNWRDQTKR